MDHDHDRLAAKLSEYRDGVLSPAEREEVARHAASCAACRAELADWDRLARAFFARPEAPSAVRTEAFVARVMARVAERADAPWWLAPRWLVPAFGVGFAALLLSFRSATGDAGSLLGAGLDRGVLVAAAPEPAAADALGLGLEDR